MSTPYHEIGYRPPINTREMLRNFHREYGRYPTYKELTFLTR